MIKQIVKKFSSLFKKSPIPEDKNGINPQGTQPRPKIGSVGQTNKIIPYQRHVLNWSVSCFGRDIAFNKSERNKRFLEEALELVQACGCSVEDAHRLVDYVFNRPVGNPEQEVGGVCVTLAQLCNAQEIDQNLAAEKELSRCWQNIDLIRAKHAAKPL